MPITYREGLLETDNDYTDLESEFGAATGQLVTNVKYDAEECLSLRRSMSVIVPSLQGQRWIPTLLDALDAQLYGNFEVVIVDDGSDPPLQTNAMAWYLEHQPGFALKIVRNEGARGYSAARNLGIQCASGETLIMSDDDMRVPRTLTFAAAVRHSHTAGCLFVGLRENVDPSVFTDPTRRPEATRDWRWETRIRPGHRRLAATPGVDPAIGTTVRILEESAMLKGLGAGRTIALWDLPSLVSAHSLSLDASLAKASGGFVESEWANRWGFDDLTFAVRLIALGTRVIPALDWTGLHCRADGREAPRAAQWDVFGRTWSRYLAWLNEPVDMSEFPSRPVRIVGTSGGVDLLVAS